MTKQDKRNNIDSFKAVKVLITKCDLDPYYKGELLRLINKVIKNNKSHFVGHPVTTRLSMLFDWSANNYLYCNVSDFWSYLDNYLEDNAEYFGRAIVRWIDESKI